VEGVNDVEVPDIGRGGLVGHVDGVPEREVPDREGLELGVARADVPPVVVVELGEAGGELAAARSRSRHDDKGLFRLDVVVDPVALVAHDEIHVRGVALRVAVRVDPDVPTLELVLELPGRGLVLEPGDHDPQDADAPVAQFVDELQGVGVVGDAEVRADLLALDVTGEDAQQQVHLVPEVLQQPELDAGVVAGQDPGGVVVVQELPAELEVEAVVETLDALKNLRGLLLDVLLVVEAHLAGHRHPRRASELERLRGCTLAGFARFVKPFTGNRRATSCPSLLPAGRGGRRPRAARRRGLQRFAIRCRDREREGARRWVHCAPMSRGRNRREPRRRQGHADYWGAPAQISVGGLLSAGCTGSCFSLAHLTGTLQPGQYPE